MVRSKSKLGVKKNKIKDNINKITKSNTDIKEGSILINLTHPNNNTFLGNILIDAVKVRLPFSVSNIVSVDVYSHNVLESHEESNCIYYRIKSYLN